MDTASTTSTERHTATFTGQITSPRIQRAVQIFYLAEVVISLISFVLNGIVLYHYAQHLPPATQAALGEMGLSTSFYFWAYLAGSLVEYLPFLVVGILIYGRRPTERIAVLSAIVLVAFGTALLPVSFLFGLGYLPLTDSLNRLTIGVTYLIYPFAWPLLAIFIVLFPDGKFVPRWSRMVALFGFVISMFWGLFPQAFGNPQGIMILVASVVPVVIFGGGLFAQIYRYRYVSTPLQRQQTKWFVAAMGVIGILTTLSTIPYVLIPELTNVQPGKSTLWYEGLSIFWNIGITIIPLAVGFAILRYRLWDVDLVINRSLVYGVATAVLVLLFAASVLVFQSLLGSTNTLAALIVSAIGPVALFNPVRKRIQGVIDRRLYHLRFDLNEVAQAQKRPDVQHPGALTGRKFGMYEILDVIGHGGMGEVYKGFGEGQTVALKVMSGEMAKDPDQLKRFAREASTLTVLDHPNIVKYFGSGAEGDQPYLAMEYVDGVELSAHLRQQQSMTLDDALDVLTAIASALDYAHQQGFIHRDIKPSNIMLRTSADRETLDAVLMDFGIAKIQDAMTAITGTGAIGTIDYMAPEQIMQAREVDTRADIYALGVVAFEMLTGERPFKGGAGQVLFAHLQQPAPDPRDLQPELPRTASKAIEKAMAKNPDERFQTAGEFVAALR